MDGDQNFTAARNVAITEEYETTASPTTAKFSLVESVFIGFVLSLIIVMSVLGNVLVCIAVCVDRRLHKTTYLFTVSLAMADLLVSILVMTFAVFNDLNGYWIFGMPFCSVWISFDVMFSTASILNLCAISVDRYLHIKKPLKYHQWMTKKVAVVMIVVVWVLSGLISFLPIQLGWHTVKQSLSGTEEEQIGMDMDLDSNTPESAILSCMMELNTTFAIVSSLVSFYIPCLLMILIYAHIYRAVRYHVRQIKSHHIPAIVVENGGPNSNNQSQEVSDHKAAITLGFIMGTFLICWSPFFLMNIIASLCATCVSPILYATLTWLGYFNSTLNPIIYSIFNKDFREAFARILRGIVCLNRRRTYDNSSYQVTAHTYRFTFNQRRHSTYVVAERVTTI
ncbi:dopamine receptor 1-like [Saccoglossus kowalevskii]|uniref:Dopamine receptor 1-like n=1 Tax=Saccoglossus kowalevskii TaxID=10224 RepID=A0ABM0GNL7_SACKO|nr:PREDICTED: dopamine receptor 1-like [Saccoglossus kowalevskii]